MNFPMAWTTHKIITLLSSLIILLSGLMGASALQAKAVVDKVDVVDTVRVAPDFQLADAEGKMHLWSEFKGKPTIIHFWATWCPYCKKLQPGLDKLGVEYSNSDLQIIGISFNEDEGARPAQTLKERGISFATLVKGEEAAKAYGVLGTPTTVFINHSGEIVWVTNISEPNHPHLKSATDFILENNVN